MDNYDFEEKMDEFNFRSKVLEKAQRWSDWDDYTIRRQVMSSVDHAIHTAERTIINLSAAALACESKEASEIYMEWRSVIIEIITESNEKMEKFVKKLQGEVK